MKKIYQLAAAALFILFACQKNDRLATVATEKSNFDIERTCATQQVLERQLAEDPTLRYRMNNIEQQTARYLQKARIGGGRTTSITIPVVVHVVYNTSEQNISQSQIESQIDVLNEDFSMRNADSRNVPSWFSGSKSSMNLQFTLSEVKRVPTKKRSFGTDDGVKFSKRGGSDAVDPEHKLNIWVCNLGQNLLGYAQFPGGKSTTDGVVILYSAFGSRDKYSNGSYIDNYDAGRTATHEIGHWINLRHIWGDATCGNDFVEDTPLHNTANYRCPPLDHRSTCTGTPLEMWMNYMDYTYDHCMYMFTAGQKLRADAVFATGGPRASMLSSVRL